MSAGIDRWSRGQHTHLCGVRLGAGFCAEVAAVAEMLKDRQTHVAAVVAVSGARILPPCGRCREGMAQIDARNLNCRVILAEDRDVPLGDLLPEHWLSEERTQDRRDE